MLALIVGIVGYMALGALVGLAVMLTFYWLIDKIREKFTDKKAQKVAVAELSSLIESCSNNVSLEQLDQLKEVSNEGYTHLIATVDDSGEVFDVEVIKDTSETIDAEVAQFINNSDEGMVVITR